MTKKIISFHSTRAKGGVGLLIAEAAAVRPDGKAFSHQLSIASDEHIPGLQQLVNEVHAHGAKMAIQLFHAGRLTSSRITSAPLLAPSALPFGDEMAQTMTLEDIAEVTKAFAQAARRARAAGFDAIELHASHGYLLQQFHSRFTNFRTDEYGGKFENRIRFTQEVIRAIRAAVGSDFPLILQFGVEEPVQNGLTLEDGIAMAKLFERETIDALHITAGLREAPIWITPPLPLPQGTHADRAAAIRRAIGGRIPVIAVGRIKSFELADELIQQGKADFVAMGRALLADAYLPRKTQAGFKHRVRPCLGCNTGCIDQVMQDKPITCTVNPFLGVESDELFEPTRQPMHIVVVGGGPSGIVAACVARHKGHKVTLFESKAVIGGRLYTASLIPNKKELQEYTQYMGLRVAEMGVDVRLTTEGTVENIMPLHPNVVIVAVGAKPFIPNIAHLDTVPYMLGSKVLWRNAEQVEDHVVLLGGGIVGCEITDFLVSKGKRVTIVEIRESIAMDMEVRSREVFKERLRDMGVKVHVNTEIVSATPQRLTLLTQGVKHFLENYGTLVISTGYRPDSNLRVQLVSKGFPVIEIGDCVVPGNLMEAIEQGANVMNIL